MKEQMPTLEEITEIAEDLVKAGVARKEWCEEIGEWKYQTTVDPDSEEWDEKMKKLDSSRNLG